MGLYSIRFPGTEVGRGQNINLAFWHYPKVRDSLGPEQDSFYQNLMSILQKRVKKEWRNSIVI